MVQVRASLTVQVNGRPLTEKQAKAVLALYLNGTQRSAARSLGISAPVLCRHLRQVEVKAGAPIMDCGARGTVLNELGETIAKEQLALQSRIRERSDLAVACTPLTEEMLLLALNAADPQGMAEMRISDDRRNVADLQAGLVDLVVLDDPLYAFEMDDMMWEEVGSDRLFHVRKGEEYALYRFGPQRLGLRTLDSSNERYRVVRTYSSLAPLLRSGYSYFVSEGLLLRKGHRPRGDEPSIPYAILCVYRPTAGTEAVLQALRANRRT
jgi:DNA-binding transcriptional LysR family regulator